MAEDAFVVRWAREWLAEWYGAWAYRMPEPMVRTAVRRLGFSGGWSELDRTARADYRAGCR